MSLPVKQGDTILLISPVSAPQQEYDRIQQLVGSNKVSYIRNRDLQACGYPSGTFDGIAAFGTSVDHTKDFFSKVSTLLKPGGKISLTEPVAVVETSKPGLRTKQAVESELLLSGFVNTETVSLGIAHEGEVETLQFCSQKPQYSVGASHSLRTRKPVETHQIEKTPAAGSSVWSIGEDDALEDLPEVQQNAWSIDENDGDHEMFDEDQLLEDIDKQVVTVLPVNDDCETSAGRRGACKNCTCGRAEMPEEELQNTKSSCGNCYLGDAFRCGGCPFLGQPAFKPGERVLLSNE